MAPLRAGGLFVALLAVILVFSALRPDTFPTAGNALAILTLAAPLAVIACGLTFVLVQGDFDLSVGSMVGLGGATAVVAQSALHLTWMSAVGLALLVAIAVGAINGVLTAYVGLSSFIVTLASGTILTGLEFSLTDQKTIYEGIDPGYSALGQSIVVGLNSQIWIALIVAVVCWTALRHTEAGRYAYAIGANPVAARLSGVRVPLLRVGGFVVSALAAAVAGILITAQASSSFSNAGQPYLLPAFAAVFLGTTISSAGRFNVIGTVIGVVLLGVIQTGLTMLQLSTAAVNLAQGGVLLVAVLFSRIGQGRIGRERR
jgi:ribose transport system permease protein